MNLSGNRSFSRNFEGVGAAVSNNRIEPGRCVRYLTSEFSQAGLSGAPASIGEVVFLCAEPCMEASCTMARFAETLSMTECTYTSYDLSVLSPSNSVAELRRIARKHEKAACLSKPHESGPRCVGIPNSSLEDDGASSVEGSSDSQLAEGDVDNLKGDESLNRCFSYDSETVVCPLPPVVLLHNVPPADESETDSEARAILRMVRSGCFVVASILPEGIQLFETFETLSPRCVCLRSADLLESLDYGRNGFGSAEDEPASGTYWFDAGNGHTARQSLRNQLAIPMLANAFRDYARGNNRLQCLDHLFDTPHGISSGNGANSDLRAIGDGGAENNGNATEDNLANEERLLDSQAFSLAGAAEAWPQSFTLDFGSSLRYATALSSLVSTSLRETLMDEERELRFAMFLLGCGSFSDLERVVPQKSLEIAQGLATDAPQFGVDLRLEKFCCAGFDDPRSIGVAFSAVEEFGNAFPTVLSRATECLLSKANSARAAQLLPMIHDRAVRTSLELRYAASLFDSGELALLRDAKRVAKSGDAMQGDRGRVTVNAGGGSSHYEKDNPARNESTGLAEAEGATDPRRCPGYLELETERLLEVLKDGTNKGASAMTSADAGGMALSDVVARCRGLLEGKALETQIELSSVRSTGLVVQAPSAEPSKGEPDTIQAMGPVAGKVSCWEAGSSAGAASIAADADERWVAHLFAWPLVESWTVLCEGVRLALIGDFPASYQVLIARRAQIDNGASGMFASALTVAYYLVAGMLGALTPQDGVRLLEAQRFFGERGFSLGRVLCEAAPEFVSLFMGNVACANCIERLVRYCERLGLHALLAWCLLAEAIEDLRTGVAVRALVRAKTARDEFLSMGAYDVGYQTDILCEAAAICLGEAAESPCALRGPKKLASSAHDVRECLERAAASRDVANGQVDNAKEGGAMGEAASGGNLGGDLTAAAQRSWKTPRSSMWLVNVLSGDCGELSVAFERTMPEAWKRALAHMTRESACGISLPALTDTAVATATSTTATAATKGDGAMTASGDDLGAAAAISVPTIEAAHRGSVEVRLLGGLSVKVNGRELDVRVLERRRAKSLLMLLATIPDHRIRRYAAIESVWPELDYESGTQRLYEATSVIRTRISKRGGRSLRPILTNRAAHSLSLNPECVVVDVDRFVEIAHRALASEGNDRMVVSLCRQVDGFYRGDLDVPTEDGLGTATKRRSQLQSLFVDCMVAGSLAALRLGRRLAAARFARRAYALQDMREDVMACFVRSLCAAGRSAEAEREYRKFAVRMVDMHRRPPSRMLRKLARELFGIVAYEDDQSAAGVEEVGMGSVENPSAGASKKGDATIEKDRSTPGDSRDGIDSSAVGSGGEPAAIDGLGTDAAALS